MFARTLACPGKCIQKGPREICQGNVCSGTSDLCLASCIQTLQQEKHPSTTFIDIVTPEDCKRAFSHAKMVLESDNIGIVTKYMIFDYVKPYLMQYLKHHNDETHIFAISHMKDALEKYFSV